MRVLPISRFPGLVQFPRLTGSQGSRGVWGPKQNEHPMRAVIVERGGGRPNIEWESRRLYSSLLNPLHMQPYNVPLRVASHVTATHLKYPPFGLLVGRTAERNRDPRKAMGLA